ncbi:mutT/nudix family protein [Mycoplasmopsis canis UFG4]|uniref:MutT/nudix family protein n=1 Tax=Mycoplasmopsis canis UFG4 TaxID=1131455 RepID=I1A5L5_9BACT|nr:NUDIX domain-containing protein [Mycoplasmopsis canis]EIE41786.1 mutT/nudix family protein [Mycoplasmopsis canis UFG4]
MDIFFKKDDNAFKMRTACIIKWGNKILLAYDDSNSYRYLPGGKVEFGEKIFDAIKREIKEELKVDLKELKEKFIDETFYFSKFSNSNVHEVCFYFEGKIEPIEQMQNSKFTLVENGRNLYFEWVNIEDLNNIDFRPKNVLKHINRSGSGLFFTSQKDN